MNNIYKILFNKWWRLCSTHTKHPTVSASISTIVRIKQEITINHGHIKYKHLNKRRPVCLNNVNWCFLHLAEYGPFQLTQVFTKLRDQYGDIFRTRMGIVNICHPEIAEEFLRLPAKENKRVVMGITETMYKRTNMDARALSQLWVFLSTLQLLMTFNCVIWLCVMYNVKQLLVY